MATIESNSDTLAGKFDPVSPTAKIVEYLRSMRFLESSILPRSELEEGQRLLDELEIDCQQSLSLLSVLFQSRYHAINIGILRGNRRSQQILEFAAGISSRGKNWSTLLRDQSYVESDLPDLIDYKRRLVDPLDGSRTVRTQGSWHSVAVNALDERSVWQALKTIDTEQPFTMVSEGLMLYFDSQEVAQYLAIMAKVLKRFPRACWVCDVVSREDLKQLAVAHPGAAATAKKIFAMTGRQVQANNPFGKWACFEHQIVQFGLKVEDQIDLDLIAENLTELTSISQALKKRIVGSRRVARIRAK